MAKPSSYTTAWDAIRLKEKGQAVERNHLSRADFRPEEPLRGSAPGINARDTANVGFLAASLRRFATRSGPCAANQMRRPLSLTTQRTNPGPCKGFPYTTVVMGFEC
jgi:hypothetical protein